MKENKLEKKSKQSIMLLNQLKLMIELRLTSNQNEMMRMNCLMNVMINEMLKERD